METHYKQLYLQAMQRLDVEFRAYPKAQSQIDVELFRNLFIFYLQVRHVDDELHVAQFMLQEVQRLEEFRKYPD